MPPKSEAGRDVETLPRARDWASESLMCFHQRAGTNESCCHERESAKSMRRRKRARTRARSGQKRVQTSIFGGVDFFHTAVEGRTNYLPPYPGSTVRYPLERRTRRVDTIHVQLDSQKLHKTTVDNRIQKRTINSTSYAYISRQPHTHDTRSSRSCASKACASGKRGEISHSKETGRL